VDTAGYSNIQIPKFFSTLQACSFDSDSKDKWCLIQQTVTKIDTLTAVGRHNVYCSFPQYMVDVSVVLNVLRLSSTWFWDSIYIYIYIYISVCVCVCVCGPGSSVGIATELRCWTVRDRIPVRMRFSARPDRPCGPLSLLYNGYRVFPGGKERPGRAADPSPLLVLRSWKSRAITLPTLWTTPGL